MLQKLTTKEPDDEQLEVALCSFLAAMVPPGQEEVLDLNVLKAMRKARELLNEAGVDSPTGGRNVDGSSAELFQRTPVY